MKERLALVLILEVAKCQQNLADSDVDRSRWRRVANTAFEALDRPSLADIAEIKRDAAHEQSMSDLAASGGIVDAP